MHVKGENIIPPLTLINVLSQTTEAIPTINPRSPVPQPGITATLQPPFPAGPPRLHRSRRPRQLSAAAGQRGARRAFTPALPPLPLSPSSFTTKPRTRTKESRSSAPSPAPRREERGGAGEGIPSARALPFLPGEGAGICTSPGALSNLSADSPSSAVSQLQGQARV